MTETNMKVLGRFLTGSRAYGYAKPTSDYDYRHVHAVPFHEVASGLFQQNPKEGAEAPGLTEGIEPTDVVSFELGHFVNLLLKGTPNTVELLFLPEECVLELQPALMPLFERKTDFLHSGFESAIKGYSKGELIAARKDLQALKIQETGEQQNVEVSHKTTRLPKRLSHVIRLVGMLRELKEQQAAGLPLAMKVQRPDAENLLLVRTQPQSVWPAPSVLESLELGIEHCESLLEEVSAMPRLPESSETLRESLAHTILQIRLALHTQDSSCQDSSCV